MDFQKIALVHQEKYPLMQAQDFVKLAYQSAFGCGHMVKDFETACERVKSECLSDRPYVYTEDIGNGYMRLHLNGGEIPVSPETVARMFCMSAEAVADDKNTFFAYAEGLKTLSREGRIAPLVDEIVRLLLKFEAGDFAPVSHTETYLNSYYPAYRVIKAEYAKHLTLISRIESLKNGKKPFIVAIDGMCASGKTTLARMLSNVLSAPVYHMDDFFLPPVKRTKERLLEAGGNVDYERFRTDVLDPLLSCKPFSFRPFDCSVMDLSEPVLCDPAPLSIVEGSYACHPALEKDYDYKIFLSVDPDTQLERIRVRNGEKMLERFKNEWIPMENRYFDAFSIREKADIALHTNR